SGEMRTAASKRPAQRATGSPAAARCSTVARMACTVVQACGCSVTILSRSCKRPAAGIALVSSARTTAACALSGESVSIMRCMAATRTGSRPAAQRERTSSRRLRSGMDRSSRQQAAHGPAVHRAPLILVALAAAQEVKLAATLLDRRLDRLGDEQGARTLVVELRIEPADPGMGTLPVAQPVIGSGTAAIDVQQKQPCETGSEQPRRRRRQKLSDEVIPQHLTPA